MWKKTPPCECRISWAADCPKLGLYLEKYCYLAVLFLLHFLGNGYRLPMETGNCKDWSFVSPSIAILMFLWSCKDPYFNSFNLGLSPHQPLRQQSSSAWSPLNYHLHLSRKPGIARHYFTLVESAAVLKNRSPLSIPSSGRSWAPDISKLHATPSWSS